MTFASVIGFALKHWKWLALGGVALLLGATTLRLHHAKADLVAARAALKDPETRATWQSVAVAARADLATCKTNGEKTEAALRDQNASLAAQASTQAAKLATAAQLAAVAQKGRASALSRAAKLEAFKGAGDACADLRAADAAVVENLK